MSDLNHDAPEDVAGHETSTPEQIHKVVTAHPENHDVKLHAAANPNTTTKTLQHMHENYSSQHPTEDKESFHRTIAGHPNAPKHIVEKHFHEITPEMHEKHTSETNDILFHPDVKPEDRAAKVKELLAAKHEGAGVEDSDLPKSVPRLSWDQKGLVQEFVNHQDTRPEDIKPFISHKHPEVAAYAASSPHADATDAEAFMKRKDVDGEHVKKALDSDNSNPAFLKAAFDRFSTEKDKKSDHYGSSSPRDIVKKIVKHKDVPDSILEHVIKDKKFSKDSGYYGGSTREEALSHDKTHKDVVKKLVQKGDADAMKAALDRGDTDEESLRIMHSHKDKLGYSADKNLLEHPNFPKDLTHQMIDESADNARAVLGRPEIDPETHKKLLDNKNQNVAIDALRHRSITPELVEHAYNRKAKAVSAAAANHSMAPASLKIAKAQKDPEAAKTLARNSSDPEVLHEIFNAHKDNPEVLEKLQENKNLSPKTINDILKVDAGGKIKSERWGQKTTWESRLQNHQNLDEAGINHYLKKDPGSVAQHPNLSSGQISGALKDLGTGNQTDRKHFVSKVMEHKNLSADDAMDIVTGKHGQISKNNFDFIHKNPEAYTKDVVKAGLATPPELSNSDLVGALAQSPHLDANEVKDNYNKATSKMTDAHSPANDHHDAIIHGSLMNPKIPESVRRDVLLNTPEQSEGHGSKVMAALRNPSTTKEELKDFYMGNHENFSSVHNGSFRDKSSATADQLGTELKKRGHEDLIDDALKNSPHPEVATSLIKNNSSYGYSNSNDSKKVKTALDNKNPEVVKAVLDSYTKENAPREDRKGNKIPVQTPKDMQQAFDKLADHPDQEVATKAFPHMSPEKQQQVLSRAGEDSADIIPHMSGEALSKMTVKPTMDSDAATAVLNHPNATHEHLMQGAAHDDDRVARAANHAVLGDNQKSKYTQDQIDQVLGKSFESHPDETVFADQAAKYSRDPATLNKMLLNPHLHSAQFDRLIENPAVKTADLEKLSTFNGPEHAEAFSHLASKSKTPVSLLSHITEHYPELLADVATNPRAASSKVLKNIVSSDDIQAKANLVKNPKVPTGIKDELLKDKSVFITSNPDDIDSDQLNKFAKDKDLNVVRAALNHTSADKVIVKSAVDQALKNLQKEPEAANKVLADAAKKKDMPHETRQKLMLHSPETAATAIRNAYQNIQPADVMDALTKYQGSPGYDDVASAAMANSYIQDPKIAEHAIQNVNLDHVNDKGHTASASMDSMFQNNKKLEPHHYDMALGKLQEARGKDFSYDKLGDLSENVKAADGHLMNTLLGDAPDKSLTPFVTNKVFLPSLLKNEKIKDQNLDKILETVTAKKAGAVLDRYAYKKLINQPRMNPERMDKIYNHLLPAANTKDKDSRANVANEALEQMADSNRISPELATKFLATHPEIVGSNPALPVEALQKAITDHAGMENNHLETFSQHPGFRLSMVKDHPEMKQKINRSLVHNHVAKNPYADINDLKTIWDSRQDGGLNSETIKHLVQNPVTDEKLAQEMLDSKTVQPREMEYNPAIGGKVWRAKKQEFPMDTGLEQGKEISEAHFRPREDKVRNVMKMIPKGGQIEWADFKRDNPNLAGDPIVAQMFTSAPKQRLSSEHAEKYLKSMPGKKFLMSYDKWTGMQRHNDKMQTVFKINNSEQIDEMYKKDPKLMGIYRMAQTAGQKTGHPNGPQAIGWSRVDTAHPEHWFVDEIQSDFNSDLSGELHDISETGHSKGMEKDFNLKPDEAPKVAQKLTDVFMGWERALLQNVIDTAKAHGIKKVSIHSGKTKTMMNKGDKEVTNKYDKLYNRMPQDMGFKADKYDSLPMAGDKGLKGQDIWTLNLEDLEKGLQAPPEATNTQNAQPVEPVSKQQKVK
jgi:hypothetical protein